MSKLPNEVRMRIARETTGSVWKIDELMEVIKKEVEAREISESVKINEERNPKPPVYPPPKPLKYPSANSLLTKDDPLKKIPQIR
jgi:hypothetical protein